MSSINSTTAPKTTKNLMHNLREKEKEKNTTYNHTQEYLPYNIDGAVIAACLDICSRFRLVRNKCTYPYLVHGYALRPGLRFWGWDWGGWVGDREGGRRCRARRVGGPFIPDPRPALDGTGE